MIRSSRRPFRKSPRTRLMVRSLEERITPATYTVTNTNDSLGGSLRQAVLNANANPGTDGIDFDNILFSSPQTITLTTGQIDIFDSVQIFGHGQSLLTISGNNASRIFDMALSGPLTQVYLTGMTLTNGKSTAGFTGDGGGGVRMGDETLVMQACTVTNCSSVNGGAIASVEAKGTFIADGCSFTHNTASNRGGGICLAQSSSSMTLTNCFVDGNSATASFSQGGGIYVATGGSATIDRSSISGNTAGEDGGGVYFFTNGALTLTNSTVSGNKANDQINGSGGGGIYFFGIATTFVIRNSTITGNSAYYGGGIGLFNFTGTSTLQNNTIALNDAAGINSGVWQTGGTSTAWDSNIIAGNTVGGATAPAGDVFFTYATTVSFGHNLIGVQDAATNATFGAGNLMGTYATPLDAKLDLLSYNGGMLPTHMLLPGSPAIDAGFNPAGLTTDQRGNQRVVGTQIDIGAVEAVSLQVANTNDSGSGSLRQTIQHANSVAGTQTITFDSSFATAQTITLTTGQIDILDSVTISGTGASLVTVSGNNNSRVFELALSGPGTTVTINSITIANGKATVGSSTDGGGGIRMGDENLTLNNCVVTNCSTNWVGGAVAGVEPNGSFSANSCTFSNNTAGNSGGGFGRAIGGSLLLANCTLSGNTAATGGGVFFEGTVGSSGFTIRNCTLSANSASYNGGGIAVINFSGTSTLQNNTIARNEVVLNDAANYGGGGIYQIFGAAAWDSNIIAGNTIAGAIGKTADLLNGYGANLNVSGATNLIGVQDAATRFTFGGGNLLGTFATPLDAKLGPLANNGGPTKTHALLPGSPAIDAGSNLGGLSNDQRGAPYARTSGKSIDIGAFEFQYAPTVNVTFGDGSNQRSMVKQIVITFSEAVNFSGSVATAFTLTRTGSIGPTGNVTLSTTATSPTNSVTLTFSGSFTEFGSLVDGFYDFTISAAQVSGVGGALDGNSDGIAGGSYFVTGNTTTMFFRLFGDANGSGITDLSDFGAFRGAFNLGANSTFDFDNDGNVGLSDFGEFRKRFNLAP